MRSLNNTVCNKLSIPASGVVYLLRIVCSMYSWDCVLCFKGWRQAATPESHRPVQRWTQREKTKSVLRKSQFVHGKHEQISQFKSASSRWCCLVLLQWAEFMELGRDEADAPLDAIVSSQKPNQCCTLIYTSGTTGQPKGVMLSHDNVSYVPRASWK